jgi:hypothetical protein
MLKLMNTARLYTQPSSQSSEMICHGRQAKSPKSGDNLLCLASAALQKKPTSQEPTDAFFVGVDGIQKLAAA